MMERKLPTMAIFKCKMCGGTLEVPENAKVCECEYCGTKQTIPSVKEENLQSLFNRANVLRMKAEFDKAADIYERIIQADETEAEAYWGLVLCKYGVEYVEDPATYKRVPTCHRTSYDAVVSDADYHKALENADTMQKAIYEAEAKAIDNIQKGILALASSESPYDVFICYKETDENNKRTVDSVIANDIYHQLTQEGFKVFYAAITLEDKLGSEYEPYIFSALNSAKVMLVIGTKPEYFEAVWVKNEWSRFMKLMGTDRSRTLIPCYRDMDAYELPEEFAHLQAQDMSKIGFINDIVRGINKIIPKTVNEESNEVPLKNEAISAGGASAEAFIRRAFIALEDGEWEKADEFCENALNIEPENAQAYLGKMLAELKVHSESELKSLREPFSESKNYKKVIRFCDETQKAKLESINDDIQERKAVALKDTKYINALSKLESSKSVKEFQEAAELFEELIPWKDSANNAELAWKKAETARQKEEENKRLKKERWRLEGKLNQINREKEQVVKDLDKEKNELSKLESELENAQKSFAKFLKKSAIESLSEKVDQKQSAVDSLYKQELKLNATATKLSQELESKYGAVIKEEKQTYEEGMKRTMEVFESQFVGDKYKLLAGKILFAMADKDKMTLIDLIKILELQNVPELRNVNNPQLAHVMDKLAKLGMVNKTVERKRTYYEIIYSKETEYILDGTK